MSLYSIVIMLLGMLEGTGDYKEDALNLIAKIPALSAAVINHHAGWGSGKVEGRGYLDPFIEGLGIEKKDPFLARVLTLFNVLHYDHGGGNLSAFSGKVVASGLEDLYGSIAAAMNALAGARHGRANQEALHFVRTSLEKLPDTDEKALQEYIRERLKNKELIYGFGHAVLKVEDPRATVQYSLAAEKFGSSALVKRALLLRQAAVHVLQENPKVSNPYPNVDAISGVLLSAAGFSYPEYYTLLFGLARVVGISIQIVYERVYARQGRGTPIVRPKYLYSERGSA